MISLRKCNITARKTVRFIFFANIMRWKQSYDNFYVFLFCFAQYYILTIDDL